MSIHLPHLTGALVLLTNPRRRGHRSRTAYDVGGAHLAAIPVCGQSVRPLSSQRDQSASR